MGRNGNSIVGQLAMASESMKVCLRVLKKGNKSRYDTYSVQDVLLFIVSVLLRNSCILVRLCNILHTYCLIILSCTK